MADNFRVGWRVCPHCESRYTANKLEENICPNCNMNPEGEQNDGPKMEKDV